AVYDMLILPGGIPGTLNLKACPKLREGLLQADREGRWLAAICAAPSVLGDLGLLKGKRATCNPSWEEKVEAAGAVLTHEAVTVDGHIITSQGMGTSTPFALAILAALQGREAADAMAKKVVWHG
ncbi:MAG: DJ-1/PfpI family protein, partial [Clostridia bacterium]|nr:DJ-1/PfpI family protein [Clostridia bacterium]